MSLTEIRKGKAEVYVRVFREECVFAFLNRAVRSATICQRPACVVEARPALAGRSAMVNTTPRSFWGFSILSSGYIGNIEFTI